MDALIGRGLELARLSALVEAVPDRGGALVLRGEPGIGKSALLGHANSLALGKGFRALRATGVESEARLPFAGLHQLVHPLRRGIGALPEPQRDALRAAMGLVDQAAPDTFLIGLATLNLLADAAEVSPLLLIVEDAHWLDHASAEVVSFVARRLESEPILLLAAIRSGTASRLDDAGPAALEIGRLPDAAAAELLDAVAPDLAADARSRVLAESAGNPLALRELPGIAGSAERPMLARPLTERLERAFTARVDELPADTRTALLIAALDDSTSLAEILAAAGLAAAGVTVDALTPAVEARLIELGPGSLVFRHPLMRSAISQAADVPARHAAHRALADVLAEQPDRRAWHRAAATTGTDESTALELEQASDRAARRGGVDAAVAALEQSARLSENRDLRAERLLRAADLAVEAGRRDVVRRLLDEACTLELSPREQARATWIRSSFDDGLSGDNAGPVELAALTDSVAADGDIDLAMRILWGAGMRCFWTEPGPEARKQLVSVADGLPVDEHDPRFLAIPAYVAPIDRGTAVLAGLADVAGGDPQVARFLGSAALQVGAFDLSARFSAAALDGLRAQGRLGLLTRAQAVRAWSSVRLGDLTVGLSAAEEAGRLAQETNQPFMFGLARAVQAEIAALRGDYDQAKALAAEAEQVGRAAGARPVLATVQRARGLTALGEGRYDDAVADLLRMHDPADPSYQLALRCYALSELAEAAIRAGRTDALEQVVRELETFAPSTTSPALHIGLRYVQAILAPSDQAEALFKAALDATNWPLERGRLHLAFGEWLRRQRRAADSRPHLRAARETFDALGVIAWADRARTELRASGETSPRRTADARDQLTPHELSIAELAAEGLTNKEIGQRLYLSHRTVSTHLHRIFPKLGITSRADLPHALRPAG